LRFVEVNIILKKITDFTGTFVSFICTTLFNILEITRGKNVLHSNPSQKSTSLASRSRELHWLNTTFKMESSFVVWTKSWQNLAKVSWITIANFLKGCGKKEIGQKGFKFFTKNYIHNVFVKEEHV